MRSSKHDRNVSIYMRTTFAPELVFSFFFHGLILYLFLTLPVYTLPFDSFPVHLVSNVHPVDRLLPDDSRSDNQQEKNNENINEIPMKEKTGADQRRSIFIKEIPQDKAFEKTLDHALPLDDIKSLEKGRQDVSASSEKAMELKQHELVTVDTVRTGKSDKSAERGSPDGPMSGGAEQTAEVRGNSVEKSAPGKAFKIARDEERTRNKIYSGMKRKVNISSAFREIKPEVEGYEAASVAKDAFSRKIAAQTEKVIMPNYFEIKEASINTKAPASGRETKTHIKETGTLVNNYMKAPPGASSDRQIPAHYETNINDSNIEDVAGESNPPIKSKTLTAPPLKAEEVTRTGLFEADAPAEIEDAIGKAEIRAVSAARDQGTGAGKELALSKRIESEMNAHPTAEGTEGSHIYVEGRSLDETFVRNLAVQATNHSELKDSLSGPADIPVVMSTNRESADGPASPQNAVKSMKVRGDEAAVEDALAGGNEEDPKSLSETVEYGGNSAAINRDHDISEGKAPPENENASAMETVPSFDTLISASSKVSAAISAASESWSTLKDATPGNKNDTDIVQVALAEAVGDGEEVENPSHTTGALTFASKYAADRILRSGVTTSLKSVVASTVKISESIAAASEPMPVLIDAPDHMTETGPVPVAIAGGMNESEDTEMLSHEWKDRGEGDRKTESPMQYVQHQLNTPVPSQTASSRKAITASAPLSGERPFDMSFEEVFSASLMAETGFYLSYDSLETSFAGTTPNKGNETVPQERTKIGANISPSTINASIDKESSVLEPLISIINEMAGVGMENAHEFINHKNDNNSYNISADNVASAPEHSTDETIVDEVLTADDAPNGTIVSQILTSDVNRTPSLMEYQSQIDANLTAAMKEITEGREVFTESGLVIPMVLWNDIEAEISVKSSADAIVLNLMQRPHPMGENRHFDREEKLNADIIEGPGDMGYKRMIIYVEQADKGVYTLEIGNMGKEPISLEVRFRLYVGRDAEKIHKGRKITVNARDTVEVKFLMPEAVFWDDEEYFTGEIEGSNYVTKFNSDTGLVWKEKRKYRSLDIPGTAK